MEGTLSNQDKSPPKKKKTPETATLDSAISFKATAASMSIAQSIGFLSKMHINLGLSRAGMRWGWGWGVV